MRLSPTLALLTSAFALAACAGGGGSSSPLSRANTLSVCAINDPSCIPAKPVSTAAVAPLPDADGDGIPDSLDKDGSVGSGAGGNTTGLTSGNRTYAIQASKLSKPTVAGQDSAISLITSSTTPTQADTEAAILSIKKPKSLRFEINTMADNNSQWAVPAEMNEYAPGTRDITWAQFRHTIQDLVLRDTKGNEVAFGNSKAGQNIFYYTTDHTTTGGAAVVAGDAVSSADLSSPFYASQLSRFKDPNGNPVVYDRTQNLFIATASHTLNGITYYAQSPVDTDKDFYWNQIVPYMGSKANGGAKADYREYRIVDKDPKVNRDEVLQVWAWSENSYSAHYVNRDGEDPKQHAWTYGGKAATNMPTTGKATYKGRFVGNANTSNWLVKKDAKINPNKNWRIQGRSELTATFGTNDIDGTLAPETWTSDQGSDVGIYTWYTPEAEMSDGGNIVSARSPDTIERPNYEGIYGTQVILNGKIKAPSAGSTASTTAPILNNFDGTATLSNGYITSNGVMQGGFMGTNGTEVSGVVNASGSTVAPIGGSSGLNGAKGAFIDINGSFHGACTVDAATGQCAP
jgi:C-lobe and N-lobe beta barrels of Tf-binding protein B